MRLKATITTTLLVAAMSLGTVASAASQPTKPMSASDITSIQLRATMAFNLSHWSIALPMLQKLEGQYKNDPAQADNLAIVQEQIRVCNKNLPLPGQPAVAAQAAPFVLTTPPVANPAIRQSAGLPFNPASDPLTDPGPHRFLHPAPKPGQVIDLQIKQLGNFLYDAEKGGNIPPDVRRLSGATIRLTGFMIPMDQAENISQFALVPTLFACCYGQPPAIQHTIVVNCPKGKAVSYYPDQIVVEGKLTVKEQRDDGFIVSIFQMRALSVKPAPQ